MHNLLFLLISFIGFGAFAQNDSVPCNCCTENYRHFDFWAGNWEVRDSSGNLLGHNHIEVIQEKCALQEHWTSAKGGSGTSLSYYDGQTDSWYQNWVDRFGGVIQMKGGLEGKNMVMLTEKRKIKDSDAFSWNKTTWIPLNDGRVRHIWEQTKDSGKTWNLVFDGFYSKVKD